MSDQLDSLSLAATERWAGLAEFKITQASVAQSLQGTFDFGHAAEKIQRLTDRKLEDLRNILSPIFDTEFFTIDPAAGADLAANKRGRKEIHLQLDSARTFAFGAA